MKRTLAEFRKHYRKQFADIRYEGQNGAADENTHQLVSKQLKTGNGPLMMSHGAKTEDALVLIHGLTDSPWYMSAIARRFFDSGVNVILPLLTGHGLREADQAMENETLADRWRAETEFAVRLAGKMGRRVSVGGLSTGGALSVNLAWRKPEMISGGILLFSAALDVGEDKELAGRSTMLMPWLTKRLDGDYQAIGGNPYKYPVFTRYGAYHLMKIINENNLLQKRKRLAQPVFSAHSIHDEAAMLRGITMLLSRRVQMGSAYIVAQHPSVAHGDLVLESAPPFDADSALNGENAPQANPQFEDMMNAVMHFFYKYVVQETGELA